MTDKSNGVIGLRLMKIAGGGRNARHEAELMVSEKVDALVEATGSLCGGRHAGDGDRPLSRERGGQRPAVGRMTARKEAVRPGHGSSNPSGRLAIVARERASEQSAKATAETDVEAAEPHRQQEMYLVKLAEVYERRAKHDAAAA